MGYPDQGFVFCACGRATRRIPGKKGGVCRFCLRANQTCARSGCGKTLNADARWSKDGLVCRSCARYYKKAGKCARCGKKSIRLSRVLGEKGGDKPLCDACREKLNRANCAYCRRHRTIQKTDDKGRPVCRVCATTGGAPIICLGCSKVLPEFFKGRCYDCYCLDLALRRHKDIRAALIQEWVKELFDRFYNYESVRAPWKQRFSTAILHYGEFFKTIDTKIQEPVALTQRRVHEIFDPNILNNFGVPYRFLLHSGTIPENEEERQAILIEFRRKRTLARIAGRWYEQDLTRYVEYMDLLHQRYKEAGHNKMLPLTILGNLVRSISFLDWMATPEAARIYKATVASKRDDEGDLPLAPSKVRDLRQMSAWYFKEYIKAYPQRLVSVRRLIRYLKNVVKLFRPFTIHDVLDMIEADKTGGPVKPTPARKKGRRWRRAKWTDTNVPTEKIMLPQDYHGLIQKMLRIGNKNPLEAVVCLFLLLYAQKAKDLANLLREDCFVDDDGFLCVQFGKRPAPLGPRVAKIVKRYLVQRKETLAKRRDPDNPYLFPGTLPGSSIAKKTVTHYLIKHKLNVTKATVSGLYYAFHLGDAHPKIIADGYGVDPSTAIRYRREAGGDVRDELRAIQDGEEE